MLGVGVLKVAGRQDGFQFDIVDAGFRALVGAGVRGYITPRFSLGAVVDVGNVGRGAFGVDAMATLGFHFGRRNR